jgi:ataxin-3
MLYADRGRACAQVAALCGVHCINTLLQGRYVNEVELAGIAQELDALERQ